MSNNTATPTATAKPVFATNHTVYRLTGTRMQHVHDGGIADLVEVSRSARNADSATLAHVETFWVTQEALDNASLGSPWASEIWANTNRGLEQAYIETSPVSNLYF